MPSDHPLLSRSIPGRRPARSATSTVSTVGAALLGAALTACGGGGGDEATPDPVTPPPAATLTVAGVAAVGQPLVGATVRLVCQGGEVASTATTGADGSWSLSLPAARPPCLARTVGGQVGAGGAAAPQDFHALLPVTTATAVRLNLTPLTELMVAHWAGGSPAARFAAPSAADWASLTPAAVEAAAAAVRAALPAGPRSALGGANPQTVVFNADGTGHDAVLDELGGLLTLTGSTWSGWAERLAAGDGAPMVPAFLQGLTPDTAAAGATVTLSGHALPETPVVRFGTTVATVAARTADTLTVVVPTGLAAGTPVALTVQGVAGTLAFTPQASGGGGGSPGLAPTQGPVGSTVTLTGSGFGPSPVVRFYDEFLVAGTLIRTEVAAVVVSASDTEIVVTVPAGANTGPVTVNGTRVGTFTVELPRVGAWTQQESMGGYALASNGTRFVKVASLATVYQGTDGATWNQSFFYASANDSRNGQVQWDGRQFVYVVSKEATSNPVQTVAVSADGLTWNVQTSERKIISWDATYASAVRDFAAVSGRITVVGDLGGLATSTDNGLTWTREDHPVGYQNHQMLAVDDTGTERVALTWQSDGGVALRSVEGGAWAVRATGLDLLPADLLWTGAAHLAVGRGHAAASGARVFLSTDGAAWRAVGLPAPYASGAWKAVRVLRHASGLWLLVHSFSGASATASALLRSTDGGETWTLDTDFGSDVVGAIALGSQQMMAVGNRTYTRPLP
ncbi:IPT/TIG domain-containing protein [Ideonella livida]|uniref:IPT/TIG domain-containing protein n=1 Tax=Ideonella livida TaxID=2707176 RepID=A0A7C9THJ6_9BURK|nr:IPT/TIG domain-containing protein [Ideonella livida]NDY90458.1 hypothetical protein [Ideonella livida]